MWEVNSLGVQAWGKAKGRFGSHRLRMGIDHLVADAGVLRPVRNQSPPHMRTKPLGSLRLLSDDLNGLSWCDVVAGKPVIIGLNTEAFSAFGSAR